MGEIGKQQQDASRIHRVLPTTDGAGGTRV